MRSEPKLGLEAPIRPGDSGTFFPESASEGFSLSAPSPGAVDQAVPDHPLNRKTNKKLYFFNILVEAAVGLKSAQSWPQVGPKSAQSRPKVDPRPAQGRPKVGPGYAKSLQKSVQSQPKFQVKRSAVRHPAQRQKIQMARMSPP